MTIYYLRCLHMKSRASGEKPGKLRVMGYRAWQEGFRQCVAHPNRGSAWLGRPELSRDRCFHDSITVLAAERRPCAERYSAVTEGTSYVSVDPSVCRSRTIPVHSTLVPGTSY